MKLKRITLVLFMFLAVFGTIFDLHINQFVEGWLPRFSRLFEIVGEIPVMMVISLSFAILSATRAKDNKVKSYLVLIVTSILGTLFSVLCTIMVLGYMAKEATVGNSHGALGDGQVYVAIFLGLLTYIILYWMAKQVNPANYRYYRRIAYLGITFSLVVVFAVNGVKYIWGRPRYWSVISGASSFKAWYQISGPAASNEYMSFVSGHTANAFTMIYFSLLAYKNLKLKNQLYSLGIIWGLAVAASRLFILQHFMTDVVFSGIIVILLFELLLRVYRLDSFLNNE